MKKIYINGNFLTLTNKHIEAILIECAKIIKVGNREEVLAFQDKNTDVIDLQGKTMMPSFIDSHSHFLAVANNFLQISLNDCKNFKDIQNKLLAYKKENDIKKGKWILANNYDHNQLTERQHPTKDIIDEVFPDNPVVIQHQSGHNGIFNTMALGLLNITPNTIAPVGGRIEKANNELTGFLEENAFIENIKKVPMPTLEELADSVRKAEKQYASYGITTVQEGMFTKELIPIYQKLVQENELTLDVIAFMDKSAKIEIESQFSKHIKSYKNNFKIGGLKIFLDGSPQAKTAWMRTPYTDNKNNYGYGTMTDQEVEDAIQLAKQENLQILAHCNGDKASEQYIQALQKFGKDICKIRPVLIHGQLLGIDQLKQIKELGIIPSYFIAHIYYWGDTHIQNFGLKRAKQISPVRSTQKEDIIFTLHQDSPVIEPNMFETIWCAVNRKTKSNNVLGEEEKIDVLEAIRAVTINAAYQYFEENTKGSIEEGKLADLIIVSQNPLEVSKDKIKDIQVLETIKRGYTIYKKRK